MEETKVIYYIEDDKVPYLVKLPVAPQNACLRDFKKFVVSQGRNFKYYFQTIVEDIGAVKEEKTDDDEKLPIEKDRAVLWLVPIESSLSGSRGDSRSQSSLNELCGPTENAAPPTTQGQFTSMNSVATNSSGSSNNENRANKQSSSNVANQRRSKSNYDSLTRKQSNQQQRPIINTALKDLNFDETSTDTESLVNDFSDLKMMPQGNKQQAKRHQFNSFNNHQQNPYGQLPSGRSHHQQPGVTVHRGGSLGSNTAHHHQAGMANIGGHHGSSSHHYNHHYMGSHPYHKQPAVSASSIPTHRKQSNKQFDTVSMLSAATSEHDTTTFFDSQSEYDDYEDDDEEIDDDDHMSSITGTTATTATSVLSKREKRRKMSSRSRGYNMMMAGGVGASRLHRNNSIHSSVTSLADSTMSLNIITVKIDMTTANFLGISIVGQSNKTGEGGIYVGSIMDGGAVALDGRIEPGDMILQVNEVSFEHMSNDDAVKVLRDAVCKPGPLKLVVAKCWDPVPKGCFQLSKQEPVYPINPSAWVAHTQAALNGIGGAQANPNKVRNQFHHPHLNHSVSSFGSTASFSTTFEDSTITSVNGFGGGGNYQQHRVNPLQQQQHYGTGGMGGGGGGGGFNRMQIDPSILTNSTGFGCTQELNLTVDSDMELIARAMSAADSGLDIRERNWLKITIPGAFIGSDLVDWLFNHVEGFPERRDARKYASLMLKNGYIRHAVSPMHFSERSYYVFGDQTTFITQNGTQGQGTLFTVDEERDGDFDSVSEYERDYAPMTFAPLQPHQQLPSSAASAASSQQPPGLTFGSNSNNVLLHSHQPKIYSNVGIGGPASDMLHHQPSNNGNYHHSSSSSNVTSNSTSTTSQNTTATTSTSALGKTNYSNYGPPPPNSFLSLSQPNSNSNNINNNNSNNVNLSRRKSSGIIAADRPNAPCQLYYPTPITSMNNTNNNTLSNSISLIQNRTNNADQSSVSINETITTSNAVPPPNSFLSSNHNNTVRENSSKTEIRSVKSDNSSSDREELASNQSRVKNESIYIQKSITTNVRSLDKVPKDIRVSKQSFCAAMENPCEFFVDVM